jgi:ABC-type amino acid transport substrate-binding protein
MRAHVVTSLFLTLFGLALNAASAAEIQVFWTNNPPLICQKNGELDCLSGLLIKNAAKAAGFTIKSSEIPWARAIDSLDRTPNALFAATGRNEFSENSFSWFFQAYSDKVNVFTLDAKLVKTEADLATLGKVAIRRGSPFFDYMKKRGLMDKSYETNDWVQAVAMLDSHRVDGMCLTNLIGTTNIVTLGKISESRVNRFPVGDMAWWVISASNKALTPELETMKKLMAAEKAKPYYQDMLKSYKVHE